MKKLICLFTILAFLGVANSMAQGLHFGLKAGVLGNKANVSGMRNQFKEESLTGFQVGPMLQYQTGFHGIALDFSLLKAAKARLKYTFSFYGFVDFVAVIPCILTYVYWNTEVVHIIILPYIFIIFKLIRHSRSFRVIGKALASVKEELETAYTASFITICFSAILMYYIERSAQPEVFENIGDGIWWAIITFATVGYGDIYPITPLGKLLGCIICLVGVAMVAIPTGIISSSFINIVQKKEKKQGEDCNNESDKQ